MENVQKNENLRQLYNKILALYLDKISQKQSEDDKTFRSKVTSQIINRDEQYTALLSHFVKITKIRNRLKEIFKWSFYFAVILSMVIFMIVVWRVLGAVLANADADQLIKAIPLFITSIVGLVSAIIAIPVAITKYLFSTKEDKNITEIILHTQEHDTTGRQWTLDFQRWAKVVAEQESARNKKGVAEQ